jgi:transcriptional regulator with XRE-family HTH domain
MNTRQSFGAKITAARKLKDLSIEELAAKAGIEPNNLSRIESGKYNPGLDILIKIADALEMELSFIKASL